MTLTKY